MRRLRAGDWVEVRSKEEILRTLDANAQLDGMPFMPQMFEYCGRKLRVSKRAHKSCDTVNRPVGLRLRNAVHLEQIRCDGGACGGCEAGCLLFWKTAWLKTDGEADGGPPQALDTSGAAAGAAHGCTEQDVWAATRASTHPDPDEPAYVCQATRLPYAATPLPWWDIRQYLEDYASGNVTPGRLVSGFLYACYFNLSRSGVGLGRPMRWLYDRFQALYGGVPFPRRTGTIPPGRPTPSATLGVRPGELVRVKSHGDILATLDAENRNRGLYFDAEAVPYCGKTFRVARRVSRIVDEKTGVLIQLKNDAIALEGVYCQARYSGCRMFCPRGIVPYWREIWLERATGRCDEAPEPGP